jgi:photosystem II stability/assembly factor-like uncharacterized protein
MTDVRQLKSGEIGIFAYPKANLSELPKYLGVFSENAMESLTKAKGGLEPVYAKGTRPNQVKIVDFTRGAPELGENSFRERVRPETRNYLERNYRADCELIFLMKLDPCGNKDDLNSAESFIIIDRSLLNNIDWENIQVLDGTNPLVEITGTFNNLNWERVVPIKFSAYAESTIVAEVLDTLFYDEISCGACAPASDGCQKIAWLTRANGGSPGLSGQYVYTEDGGSSFTSVDLVPLGGLSPNRFTAVSDYIVVVSEADASIVYFLKSDPTSQTQIQTGLVSGGAPRALYAKSAGEVIIGGAGGYIYRSEDITTGVEVVHDGSLTTQNVNDIHWVGQIVVSAHNNNVILVSTNNGQSFGASPATPEVGANLTAVWVVDAYKWWIGTNTGKLWYTQNAGVTWTQRQLPSQSSLSVINDIQFSDELAEVGSIAAESTTRGYIFRTISGGRRWVDGNPLLSGIVASGTNGVASRRFNAVALCGLNTISTGGLKQSSTDGVIALAIGD